MKDTIQAVSYIKNDKVDLQDLRPTLKKMGVRLNAQEYDELIKTTSIDGEYFWELLLGNQGLDLAFFQHSPFVRQQEEVARHYFYVKHHVYICRKVLNNRKVCWEQKIWAHSRYPIRNLFLFFRWRESWYWENCEADIQNTTLFRNGRWVIGGREDQTFSGKNPERSRVEMFFVVPFKSRSFSGTTSKGTDLVWSILTDCPELVHSRPVVSAGLSFSNLTDPSRYWGSL